MAKVGEAILRYWNSCDFSEVL